MDNFFLGVIAGVLMLLVAMLVPVLLQVLKTLRAAEMFMRTTQEALDPLIPKLSETLDRANKITSGVEESVCNVQHLSRTILETGEIVGDVNRLMRQAGMFLTATTMGFGAGIRAALGVLTKGAVEKITSSK